MLDADNPLINCGFGSEAVVLVADNLMLFEKSNPAIAALVILAPTPMVGAWICAELLYIIPIT